VSQPGKSWRLAPLMLAAVVWLGSCATVPKAPVVELPTAQQALERLAQRRQAVQSFSLLGEIMLQTPRGELYGDHLVMGAYPDRLRAEVVGPFGRPVLNLVSDGAWLAVVDYQEGRAYWGRATRANLRRFLGLYLSLEEIYALLTGCPPVLEQAAGARVVEASGRTAARLELMAPGGAVAQSLTFSPADYQVTATRVHQWGGGLDLAGRFGRFQPAGAFSYPRRVELTDGDRRKVVLTSDRLEINPSLDSSLFEPKPPPGMPVEVLD
jgi:outer membrane lipoprotein-sorting protein